MWTHRHPYEPTYLDLDSIERSGRLALYQTLRSGKLVALVGSGVSAPNGMPSWMKIAVLYAKATIEVLKEISQDKSLLRASEREVVERAVLQLTQALNIQAEDTAATPPNPAAITQLMSEDNKIAEIESRLKKNEAELEGVDALTLVNICDNILNDLPFLGESHAVDEADGSVDPGPRSASALERARQCFAKSLLMLETQGRKKPTPQDVIKYLVNDCNLTRFLTLNYDTVIENAVAAKIGDALQQQKPSGYRLLDLLDAFSLPKDAGTTSNALLATLQDGTHWAASSTTLRADDLSEIVDFAAFPQRFDHQVFHLHGRRDDPLNMVLTETDYRRIYLRNGHARQSFSEAQEVLFGGNDILFLGVGMTEDDVLRPLRQFAGKARRTLQSPQRVVALLPSKTGPNYRADNLAFAAKLKEVYDVYTIYYGHTESYEDTEFRTTVEDTTKGINDAVRQLSEAKKTFTRPEDAERHDCDLRRKIREHQTKRSDAYAEHLLKRLRKLKTESDHWWDDWLALPATRRARYHRVDYQTAPFPKNLDFANAPVGGVWARHLPDYVVPKLTDCRPVLSLRKVGRGAHKESVKKTLKRRILRAATPRGGGKGALFNLLLLPENHSTLFADCGNDQPYQGAFFAHLSFSNEFSSAVMALSRFFAGQIAIASGLGQAGQREYEDDPTKAIEGEPSVTISDERRPNRILLLRDLLGKFEKVARDNNPGPHSGDKRVLICLSGLDRICDADGDGINPMHRALFRLLAGTAETVGEGSELDPPIDLVLISGERNTPITYLSEEYVTGRGETPPEHLRPHLYQNRKTGRWLYQWHALDHFSWEEKLQLAPNPLKPRTAADLDDRRKFLDDLNNGEEISQQLGPNDQHRSLTRPNRYLQQTLWDNHLLFVLLLMYWERKRRSEQRTCETTGPTKIDLARFDRAVRASGPDGLIGEILKAHGEIDRIGDASGDAMTPTSTPPTDTSASTSRLNTGVLDSICRHLTLFSLPVELSVLTACPTLYVAIAKELDVPSQYSSGEKISSMFQRYWKRGEILRYLKDHLLELECRGIVTAIHPANSRDQIDSDQHPQYSVPDDDAQHRRYALHPRLREYYGKAMGLRLPDFGDREHFQVSVVCDQPRELPTPYTEHFEHLRGILDEQLRLCRQTLRIPYRLKQEPRVPRPDIENAAINSATTRNFWPDTPSGKMFDHIAGHFGRIHAVPQRLRGSFSLLRGAFSLGAISRLDRSSPHHTEAPLETYNGWLRSILNAAVGLDVQHQYFSDVLNVAPDRMLVSHLAELNREFPHETAVPQVSGYKTLRHPFYFDEVLWLYNERGLTCLLQGKHIEAMHLFNQALFLVEHNGEAGHLEPFITTQNNHSLNATARRIRLNKAMTSIETGNIAEARALLTEIVRTSAMYEKATPSYADPFARAYLALCDHLSGSIEPAQNAYREAIKLFLERGQLRAAATFGRHLADAYAFQRKPEEARIAIQNAIGAAAHAEQQDVRHLALLSRASLDLDEAFAAGAALHTGTTNTIEDHRKTEEALAQIDRTLDFSADMGFEALRTAALTMKAKALLRKGEHGMAGELAAEAIAIANRNGQRLRKLRALLLYAEVLEKRGDFRLARRILDETKAESEAVGYQTNAAGATYQLARIAGK